MKRRWLGVVLMAWASIISLLILVPSAAHADGETFEFKDATTITGKGGDIERNSGEAEDFKFNAGHNQYEVPGGTFNLKDLVRKADGTYSATFINFNQPNSNQGTVTVTDPKKVGPGATTTPGGGAAAGDEEPADCNAGPALTWLICDIIIHPAVDAIDWVRDKILVPFLKEGPLARSNADGSVNKDVETVYQIWSAFRNVASILFILAFFVMIFGTALNFSNYTAKKLLPQLVAAAIFVPLSWYLCVFMVDIGNILGQGLVALTSGIIPKASLDFTKPVATVFFATGGLLVGAAAVTALATISAGVLISILLAMLSVFFTLVLRKILIVLLIVLSPFAFLRWKMWWTNFFRLIMMYPLIMLLFEVGRLFAAVAGTVGSGSFSGTVSDGITPLLQLAGLMMPLALVPWTFKWTGGILALGVGTISKAAGALDKQYGKNSAREKDRAAERERKNLIREGNAPATMLGSRSLGNMRKGLYRGRAGHGFRPNSRNVTQQNRRAEAFGKATGATANYEAARDAKRPGSGVLPETSNQRIEAERIAAYDKQADDKGARAGIRAAATDLGETNRAERYDAAQIAAYKKRADHHGQEAAVLRDHGSKSAYMQSAGGMAEAAKRAEEVTLAQQSGGAAGMIAAGANTNAHLADIHGQSRLRTMDDAAAKRTTAEQTMHAEAIAPEDMAMRTASARVDAIKSVGAQKAGRIEARAEGNLMAARGEGMPEIIASAQAVESQKRADDMAGRLEMRTGAAEEASAGMTRNDRVDIAAYQKMKDNSKAMGARREARNAMNMGQLNAAAAGYSSEREVFRKNAGITAGTALSKDSHDALDAVGAYDTNILNEQEAHAAANPTAPAMSDATARQNLLQNAGAASGRDVYNRATGQATRERSIAANRANAAVQLVNEGKAPDMATAGRMIDQADAKATYQAVADEVTEGANKVIGGAEALKGEEDKLMAGTPGMTRPEAAAVLATTKGSAARLKASETTLDGYGTARGTISGNEGGLLNEMDTVVQNATPFPTDITLADGRIIPAGTMVPAGTKVAPGTKMPATAGRINRDAAQQRLRDASVQATENTTDLTTAANIGRDFSNANARVAAEAHERATTLGADQPFADVTVGADHTLATNTELGADTVFDKDVMVAGAKVKAGTTVKAGSVLDAGTVVGAGTKLKNTTLAKGTTVQSGTSIATQLNPDQARERVSQKAVVSSQEQTARSQASTYGDIDAYNQASSVSPTDADRRTAAAQQSLDTITQDTAKVQARSNLTSPGKPMYRPIRTALTDAQRVEEDRILDARVIEAGRTSDPELNGVPIKSVDLKGGKDGNIAKLGKLMRSAMKNDDIPTAIAIGQRLSQSDSGNHELQEIRLEKPENGGFGGTYWDTVDEGVDPQLKTYWDKLGARTGDGKKPTVAASDDLSPDVVGNLGPQEAGRYLEYYTNAEDALAAEATYESDVVTTQSAIESNMALPEADREAATARRVAAEARLKNYGQIMGDKRWKKSATKFVGSVEKALKDADAGTIKFQPNTIVAIAIAAEQARKAALPPTDPDYDPALAAKAADYDWMNADADSRAVRDDLIRRAELIGKSTNPAVWSKIM